MRGYRGEVGGWVRWVPKAEGLVLVPTCAPGPSVSCPYQHQNNAKMQEKCKKLSMQKNKYAKYQAVVSLVHGRASINVHHNIHLFSDFFAFLNCISLIMSTVFLVFCQLQVLKSAKFALQPLICQHLDECRIKHGLINANNFVSSKSINLIK